MEDTPTTEPEPTPTEAPAETPAAEAPPAADPVVVEHAPAADATPPAEAAEAPAQAEGEAVAQAEGEAPAQAEGEAPKQPSLGKIKRLQQSHAHRPRRGGGGPGRPGEEQAGGEGGQGQGQRRGGGQGGGGKGKGGNRSRGNRPPRPVGPLPFDELREAARHIAKQHGTKGLREAWGELAEKERKDLGTLVAGDGDFRVRARKISAGSLAAGKLGKALAAQQVAIADVKDLWPLCLSKEEAAERQAWVRNARMRDEQRAKRQEERAKRTDRLSKEDMEKARDGRVGAQIRFVIAGEERDRDKKAAKKKDEPQKKKTTAADLLDRLGY